MSILKRFSDIMSSNINAALDKIEDPEKMVDQYIRNLEKDLSEIKKETASIMANEKSVQRDLLAAQEKAKEFMNLASKAVAAGNDEDAKRFLAEKNKWEQEVAGIQGTYDTAKQNADRMRQMHDKVVHDLQDLQNRKNQIKSKAKMAKTQKNINKMTEAMGSASGIMGKFDRLEQKADKMLDEANAMSDLSLSSSESSIKDLADKYAGSSNSYGQSVDDELAALKASMGK